MDFRSSLFCVAISLLSGIVCAETESTNKSPTNYVRVLIDVSGSMKQNDPDNLRIPALKLLIHLLPSGSQAGMWLFAEDTIPLIPSDQVNRSWKDNALKASARIHSKGLFTNIEAALTKATEGWKESGIDSKHSIILLTDGVVDVSKIPEESTQSRARIIKNLIPTLQQAGIEVHTIALSDNADHELLKNIAFDTGGWNESAKSADQLQRVFLKMFKKSIPQDSLPLKNNRFTVDESVREFTMLVFRKPGAKPTQLISPEGIDISQDNTLEGENWHHQPAYDLISIKQPAAGEWRLIADTDPDNHVTIVTDLQLSVSDLPNYATQNEALDISASLTEKGQLIVADDFLNLIQIQLYQTDQTGTKQNWSLQPDSSQKGWFSQSIGATLGLGKHELKLVADGKTFQREISRSIEIIKSPVTVQIEANTTSDTEQLEIKLMPDLEIVDLESMHANAILSNSIGNSKELALIEENGVWILKLNAPSTNERLTINFVITAKTLQSIDIKPKVRPLIIDEAFLANLFRSKSKPVIDEISTEIKVDNTLDDFDESLEQESTNSPDWITTGIIALIVNVFLVGAGFFSYRFIKKRKADINSKLIERLTT